MTNPATTTSLTDVAFVDEIPSELAADSITFSGTGCRAATLAGNTVTLVNGVVPIGGSCIYDVTLRGVKSGQTNNQVSVSAAQARSATSVNAPLFVIPLPIVKKTYLRSFVNYFPEASLGVGTTNPVSIDHGDFDGDGNVDVVSADVGETKI